jgi:hypothetical protein
MLVSVRSMADGWTVIGAVFPGSPAKGSEALVKGAALLAIDGAPVAPNTKPSEVAAALTACAATHGQWVLDVLPPSHVLLSPGQMGKGPAMLAMVLVPVGVGPEAALPTIATARRSGCFGDGDKVVELAYRWVESFVLRLCV